MPQHPLIVIGASAGGLVPLKEICRGLSKDFGGTLLLISHMPSGYKSHLTQILQQSAPIPAFEVEDGMAIARGNFYVGPPDYHVLVEGDRFRLWHGPKENRHRPSINVTMRSVAGSRRHTIGVILSGLLDDGAMGVWYIKKFGGTVIVQDPEDAEFPSMPQSALEHVSADYSVPAREMGELLSNLVKAPCEGLISEPMEAPVRPVAITCPECHGPLSEYRHGQMREFRCLVGHAYTPKDAILAHHESEERSMWAAKAQLEESAQLLERIAHDLSPENLAVLQAYTGRKLQYAKMLGEILEKIGPPPTLD